MTPTTKNERLEDIANIASTPKQYPPQIMRFILQSCAREILPDERVSQCLRKLAPLKTHVEIHKSREGRAAYYKNLVVCSRIWHCPVCAARITEERRRELHKATVEWTGGLALVTYTARHSSRDKLAPLLDALISSFRAFKAGRVFQEIRDHYGWVGSVRALEVTHADNGWHPHIHEAVFFTNNMDSGATGKLEFKIKRHWSDVLARHGLSADHEHGVTLRDGWKDISEYVSKYGDDLVQTGWTLSHEITKQPVKKGKLKGKSPTQLLYDYWEGDMRARFLWKEYAVTFKGKHQLVWSRGLRELLGMGEEKTDEQLAEEIPADTVLLATLTVNQWRGILKAGVVGDILYKAANESNEDFALWLADILERWTPL